jgi:hypothetical protein
MYRTMCCSASFDVFTLGNYSFYAYGFENSQLSGIFGSNLIKYSLFPFKEVVCNEMTGSSSNNTLLFDYVIPIYGFEVKIDIENGQLVNSNNLDVHQMSCFNKLVFLLNEAKFYDQMRQISYLTEQDIFDSFKFRVK